MDPQLLALGKPFPPLPGLVRGGGLEDPEPHAFRVRREPRQGPAEGQGNRRRLSLSGVERRLHSSGRRDSSPLLLRPPSPSSQGAGSTSPSDVRSRIPRARVIVSDGRSQVSLNGVAIQVSSPKELSRIAHQGSHSASLQSFSPQGTTSATVIPSIFSSFTLLCPTSLLNLQSNHARMSRTRRGIRVHPPTPSFTAG